MEGHAYREQEPSGVADGLDERLPCGSERLHDLEDARHDEGERDDDPDGSRAGNVREARSEDHAGVGRGRLSHGQLLSTNARPRTRTSMSRWAE